jgi:PAS domain S-box-containing protein
MISANSSDYPGIINENIVFENIGIEQGLSQTSVSTIYQDRLGYLWFGTMDGLNRYDGYDFVLFSKDPNNPNSLPNNSIKVIAEDDSGYLWIGTLGGLIQYDQKHDKYRIYRTDYRDRNSLPSNVITAIANDKTGRLWVGTSQGLAYFNRRKNRFTRYHSRKVAAKRMLLGKILNIYPDNDGSILVGTEHGLTIIKDDKSYSPPDKKYMLETLRKKAVNQTLVGPDNKYYVATGDGLYIFDTASKNFTPLNRGSGLLADDIRTVHFDFQDNLWIGSDLGINILTDMKKLLTVTHIKNNPYSLIGGEVETIFSSRDNVVWIGMSSGGISKFNPRTNFFHRINSQLFKNRNVGDYINKFFAITKESKDILWVGSEQGITRINLFNLETTHFTHQKNRRSSLAHNRVRSILYSEKSGLWIGTYGGLDHFNSKKKGFTHYNKFSKGPNFISNDTVSSIWEMKSGDLLIGTYGGGVYTLNIKNRKLEKLPPYRHSILNKALYLVLDVIEGKNGDIWIASFGGGVLQYHRKSGEYTVYRNILDNLNSIGNDYVFSVLEDSDNIIWFGTSGGGLDSYNPEKNIFNHFTMKNGLPNNFVYGILEDNYGYLWLSTNNGISRFTRGKEKNRGDTSLFLNFTPKDGITDKEYNFGAFYKDKSGYLYFGGINGITWFNPEKIKENHYDPPILITRFSVLNRPVKIGGNSPLPQNINYLSDVTLTHRDYTFTIAFAAIDYSNPNKIKYAYRMNGVDDDWIITDSKHRYATYTTLNGGNYSFYVRATNSSGVWSNKSKIIKFTIVPPFWDTFLFRILALFSLIGFIGMLFYLRTISVVKKNRALQEVNEQLNQQIRKREMMQKALRESEEKYRLFVERANDGIVIIQNEKIEYCNPNLANMLGYERPEELIGRNPVDFIYPDDKKIGLERLKKRLEGKDIENLYETRFVRKDGTILHGEVNASIIIYNENPATMVFIRDISERLNLEEQIRQIQKMDAIGQLAGGVAHDFNNLLTVINGNAELLMMLMKKDGEFYKYVEEIHKSGERAENLTRQLLAFSRKQIIEVKPMDINKIIANMNKMLSRLIGENISMELRLGENLPPIKVDIGQLEQIIMNLMINSRDAILALDDEKKEKRIVIETRLIKLDNTAFNNIRDVSSGHFIQLTISDTGIGMSKEISEKIFEPFFTTKKTGKGTGLGLATVFGIVKQNKGHITVYSEPGVGTSINIFWPVTEVKAEETEEESAVKTIRKGTENILLVEDDFSVRQFASKTLEELGYKVHSEENGLRAIEFLKRNKDKFDLIITDIIMPEMNGKEMVTRLKELNYDFKILYTSGYTDSLIIKDGSLEEGVNFLQKPYTILDLSNKIREILD